MKSLVSVFVILNIPELAYFIYLLYNVSLETHFYLHTFVSSMYRSLLNPVGFVWILSGCYRKHILGKILDVSKALWSI